MGSGGAARAADTDIRRGSLWARAPVLYVRGIPPLLLETFVDPSRYRGACYRAAGWELLGQTSGRGPRPGKAYRSTPRLVLVKPVQADCRRLLCGAPAGGRQQP